MIRILTVATILSALQLFFMLDQANHIGHIQVTGKYHIAK